MTTKTKENLTYCDNCCATKDTIIDYGTQRTHSDYNRDGKCDYNDCGHDLTEGCGHLCHKDGIAAFFFDFILFFQKLFKANQICACGEAHY